MSTLPDYILNVLPGGKYHDMAVKYAKHGGVLQWKDDQDCDWNDWKGDALPCTNLVVWRIKPEMLRYRVAILRHGTVTADNEREASALEARSDFIKWDTPDWIEYEVWP